MDTVAPENHAQPATTPTDLVLDVVFLPTSGLHDQQSFWQAQFGRWAQEKLWVRQIYWPSVLADPVLDTSTVVSSSPAPGDNVAVSEALDPAAVAVEDAFTISAGPFVAPTMVWQQFRKWREFRKLRRRDPVNRQRPRKLLVLSGQNQATLDAINQADFPARLRTALTQTEYEVVLLLNDGNETSLVGENTIRSENSTSVAETTTLATTTTTSSSPSSSSSSSSDVLPVGTAQGSRWLTWTKQWRKKLGLIWTASWTALQGSWWGAVVHLGKGWWNWMLPFSKGPHPLQTPHRRAMVLGASAQQVLLAAVMWRWAVVWFKKLSFWDMAQGKSFKAVPLTLSRGERTFLWWGFWALVTFFCLSVTFGSFQVGSFGDVIVAPKNFSDFVSHISLIRSFSMGSNYPVEYPVFSGEPIRYHYLFFWVVAMLEKAGIRLDLAFNLLSTAGMLFLMAMIYKLSCKIFRLKLVGLLAVTFFLFHGALVILDFLQQNPAFYHIYNWVDIGRWFANNQEWISFAPWNKSEITAFWNFSLYNNQRHLALALGLSLFFIYRMEKRSLQKNPSWWEMVAWAVVISICPVFHQPTVLIFAILLLCYFILLPHRAQTFMCGIFAIAGLILVDRYWFHFVGNHTAANLHFDFRPEENIFVTFWHQLFNPFYMMEAPYNAGHFVTYWFKNLGLHLILLPLGLWFAPRRWRKIWLPALVVFILGNTFQFSREMAGQHKLFNFVLVLSLPFTAAAFVFLLLRVRRIKSILAQGALYLLLGGVFLTTVQGGIFDNVILWNDCHTYKFHWPPTPEHDQVSHWIKIHTAPQDRILTNVYLFNPASVVGRRIFLGWPYFAWSAGYDSQQRSLLMYQIYTSYNWREICHFLKHYNLAWFLAAETHNDPNLPSVEIYRYMRKLGPDYFNRQFETVIYSRDRICAAAGERVNFKSRKASSRAKKSRQNNLPPAEHTGVPSVLPGPEAQGSAGNH